MLAKIEPTELTSDDLVALLQTHQPTFADAPASFASGVTEALIKALTEDLNCLGESLEIVITDELPPFTKNEYGEQAVGFYEEGRATIHSALWAAPIAPAGFAPKSLLALRASVVAYAEAVICTPHETTQASRELLAGLVDGWSQGKVFPPRAIPDRCTGKAIVVFADSPNDAAPMLTAISAQGVCPILITPECLHRLDHEAEVAELSQIIADIKSIHTAA